MSSDDPGFFGYDGVTMDYVMAFMAWELDIADLKKLALNGITYSSIPEERKTELIEKRFNHKWD